MMRSITGNISQEKSVVGQIARGGGALKVGDLEELDTLPKDATILVEVGGSTARIPVGSLKFVDEDAVWRILEEAGVISRGDHV